MTVYHRIRASGTLAIVAAGTLLLTACDDSPTDVDDEHVDPAGFAIELDGAEVLRYLDAEGGSPTLVLTEGATYETVVVFLDADGDPLVHAEHGPGDEEEALDVTIGSTSIVAWTPEDHADEHPGEEHLEFHGELAALAEGTTTLQLCILHEAHCDYEPPPVSVTVE